MSSVIKDICCLKKLLTKTSWDVIYYDNGQKWVEQEQTSIGNNHTPVALLLTAALSSLQNDLGKISVFLLTVVVPLHQQH